MPTKDFGENEKRITKSLYDAIDASERKVLRYHAEAFESIRGELAEMYEKYAVDGKLTRAEMTRYNRLERLYRQMTEDMRPVFLRTTREVKRIAEVEYARSFYRLAWAIDQDLGVGLSWGLINEAAVRRAIENPLKDVAESRYRRMGLVRIRQAVAGGVTRGDSFPKMARAVRDAINGTANDAMRIVRTEGQRAMNLGIGDNYARARDLGVEMQEVWDATLDSRTRPRHGALDGQIAKTDDAGNTYWTVSGIGRVPGPLQTGVASFDINCRCRRRGQIAGFEPTRRRVGEISAYETFTEWAERNNITRNVYGQRVLRRAS